MQNVSDRMLGLTCVCNTLGFFQKVLGETKYHKICLAETFGWLDKIHGKI